MARVRSVTLNIDPRRVDVERDRIDIDQDGTGVEVPHHFRRSRKRVRRGDDLVALLEPDGFEGQVHRRCARIDGNSMLGAYGLGKGFLKLARLRPRRQRA